MPRNTQVRTIVIKGVVQGDKEFRRLARQIGTIQKSTVNLSRSFNGLRNIFAAGLFGVGLRELTQAIDSFQLLEDRIKVFTGSTEDAERNFNQLAESARFTRSSIDALAQSYNRVALATNELELSQEEILATTTLLQQTFRISGATIAEATSSTIQLAQGLSSGQLRGQELRSVLEQNAVFANLLSRELDITRGQLIKFAESGQITSDRVLKALFNNFQEINDQAGQLGTTIGQSLTIAFDQFRLKLRELNKDFQITQRVSQGILFLADNIDNIGRSIATLGTILATAKLIKNFRSILLVLSPLNVVIGATVGAIAFLAFTWETSGLKIEKAIIKLQLRFNKFSDFLEGFLTDAGTTFLRFIGLSKDSAEAIRAFVKANNEVNRTKLSERLSEINKELIKLSNNAKSSSFENFLKQIAAGFNNKGIVAEGTGQFAQLNKEFGKSIVRLQQYRNAYEQLRFDQLNADFTQGKITLQAYVEEFTKLNSQVAQLGNGTAILQGFQLALNDTFNNVGNLISNVRDATNATFKELEDRLLEFVKTGKFEFADFAQFVLDELTKIVIRLSIIRPLAQGIFGATTGPSFSTPTTSQQFTNSSGAAAVAANGLALNRGNVIPFANGGVVNSPTNFGMSGNRVGLMGEAGPEAIIPLERGPNGKLGVNASGASGVVVNVNNFSNSEVEVRESTNNTGERELEIIINNSVAKGIGEGRFDRQFQQSFSLQRRGS